LAAGRRAVVARSWGMPKHPSGAVMPGRRKHDGETNRQAGRDSFDSSSNAQRSAEVPKRADNLRPEGQKRQETRKGPKKTPSIDRKEGGPTDEGKGKRS